MEAAGAKSRIAGFILGAITLFAVFGPLIRYGELFFPSAPGSRAGLIEWGFFSFQIASLLIICFIVNKTGLKLNFEMALLWLCILVMNFFAYFIVFMATFGGASLGST